MRTGMSLLEVLISMFVLTIGILSVAALLPVGRYGMVESGKADRAGACGHAALAEVRVREMLDYRRWSDIGPATANRSFAIDPLGVAQGLVGNLAGDTTEPVVPRISLKSSPTAGAMTLAEAEAISRWRDDLIFNLPEDITPRPAIESTRPVAGLDASGAPQYAGNYTWLVTVTPAAAEMSLPPPDKNLYAVSVAVCYKRSFSISPASGLPEGEHAASVEFLGSGYGGGSIQLAAGPDDPPLRLREDEWLLLCGQVGGRTICNWYRVVSADTASPTVYVSLMGPDWDATECPKPTAVVIDDVVGVYTTIVELDRRQ